MTDGYLQNNGKRIKNSRKKGLLSIIIIIAIMIPILPVQAKMQTGSDHPEAYWKHYPYYPPGTDIIFPSDEGAHDTQQFPIEWWYVNFHLTGQTTGHEYGSCRKLFAERASIFRPAGRFHDA